MILRWEWQSCLSQTFVYKYSALPPQHSDIIYWEVVPPSQPSWLRIDAIMAAAPDGSMPGPRCVGWKKMTSPVHCY